MNWSVAFDPISVFGLDKLELSGDEHTSNGKLSIYAIPDHAAGTGYMYDVYFDTGNIEQRPACAAEHQHLLFKCVVQLAIVESIIFTSPLVKNLSVTEV